MATREEKAEILKDTKALNAMKIERKGFQKPSKFHDKISVEIQAAQKKLDKKRKKFKL